MLLVYLVPLHQVILGVLDVHLGGYAVLGVALLQALQLHPSPLFQLLLLCDSRAYVFDLIQMALPGLLQPLQLAKLAFQGALQRLVQFGRIEQIGIQLLLPALQMEALPLVLGILIGDSNELGVDAFRTMVVIAEPH